MALMDVFTHFSIIRRERRGIRPEEIKEKEVLPLEIEQAIKNKAKFEKNPELHTYFQELI
jgi:hypothetical protein